LLSLVSFIVSDDDGDDDDVESVISLNYINQEDMKQMKHPGKLFYIIFSVTLVLGLLFSVPCSVLISLMISCIVLHYRKEVWWNYVRPYGKRRNDTIK